MNYELIKFKNDGVELEVNVSPEEETVWLSLDDMATLFERDRSVVGKHVKNALKEECDKRSVWAKFARTGPDGKQYYVDFYNLVHRKGITVIGAHNMARPLVERRPGVWTMKEDMALLLRFLSAGRLQVKPLLSRIADPTEAPEIYDRIFARNFDQLGFVFDWRKY